MLENFEKIMRKHPGNRILKIRNLKKNLGKF